MNANEYYFVYRDGTFLAAAVGGSQAYHALSKLYAPIGQFKAEDLEDLTPLEKARHYPGQSPAAVRLKGSPLKPLPSTKGYKVMMGERWVCFNGLLARLDKWKAPNIELGQDEIAEFEIDRTGDSITYAGEITSIAVDDTEGGWKEDILTQCGGIDANGRRLRVVLHARYKRYAKDGVFAEVRKGGSGGQVYLGIATRDLTLFVLGVVEKEGDSGKNRA